MTHMVLIITGIKQLLNSWYNSDTTWAIEEWVPKNNSGEHWSTEEETRIWEANLKLFRNTNMGCHKLYHQRWKWVWKKWFQSNESSQAWSRTRNTSDKTNYEKKLLLFFIPSNIISWIRIKSSNPSFLGWKEYVQPAEKSPQCGYHNISKNGQFWYRALKTIYISRIREIDD